MNITGSLKRHFPAEIAFFFIFMLYRQMPPNMRLSWIKRFYRAKQKQYRIARIEVDYAVHGI